MKSSIFASIAPQILEENLPPSQVAEVKTAYDDGQAIRCWAMTKQKRSIFDQMQQGDIVLFSINGTGKFSYMSSVVMRMDCPRNFGEAIWPYIPNNPWTLVYFLKDVTRKEIDKRSLTTALGYSPKYWLPGTVLVRPERLQKLTDSYGSIPQALDALTACEFSSPHK
jgi:hypothetical protein